MLDVKIYPFPVLHTKRLTLRELTPDDAYDMYQLRSNDIVMRYIQRPRTASIADGLAQIVKVLELQQKNEGINWAMSFLGESGLIGTIGIFNIRKEHYRAEFGYMLHPDYHRQNLMQEAFQPVLEYAFTTMGLHSLEANVDPMNKASIGILEKNGFVREAYFREDFYWQGKFLDSAVYSLLAPKQQTT